MGKRIITHFVKNHFIEIPKGDNKVEIQKKFLQYFCMMLSRDTHGITLFSYEPRGLFPILGDVKTDGRVPWKC